MLLCSEHLPLQGSFSGGGACAQRRYDLGVILGIYRRPDCGISMLHIEVAAPDCGVQGKWEFMETPSVAKFTIISGG